MFKPRQGNPAELAKFIHTTQERKKLIRNVTTQSEWRPKSRHRRSALTALLSTCKGNEEEIGLLPGNSIDMDKYSLIEACSK